LGHNAAPVWEHRTRKPWCGILVHAGIAGALACMSAIAGMSRTGMRPTCSPQRRFHRRTHRKASAGVRPTTGRFRKNRACARCSRSELVGATPLKWFAVFTQWCSLHSSTNLRAVFFARSTAALVRHVGSLPKPNRASVAATGSRLTKRSSRAGVAVDNHSSKVSCVSSRLCALRCCSTRAISAVAGHEYSVKIHAVRSTTCWWSVNVVSRGRMRPARARFRRAAAISVASRSIRAVRLFMRIAAMRRDIFQRWQGAQCGGLGRDCSARVRT
jgi:hypothetical protein